MLDGVPSLEIAAIRTLAQYRQWVLWRAEPVNGEITKVPYQPNGYKASPTNPRQWSSLNEVYEAKQKTEGAFAFNGVGFALNAATANRIMGVDLDKCRDPDSGHVDPEMQEIVDKFHSYTEVSPSGRGIRIFCYGVMEAGARHKVGRVEIYSDKRYLTVTGNQMSQLPDDLQEAQEAVDWLAEKLEAMVASRHHETKKTVANGHRLAAEVNGTAVNGHPIEDNLVAELEPFADMHAAAEPKLLKALQANSERFLKTWRHEREDAKEWSTSEYDMALASMMTAAKWPPVEIMRGLIQHRRESGEELKLDRNPRCDYYLRTIRAARWQRKQDDAQDTIRSAVNARRTGENDMDRDSVLESLSVIYGCEITGIERYSGDEPEYVITTTKGQMRGNISVLMSQANFRKAFASITDEVVRPARPADHDKRIAAMLQVAEKHDVGPDATTTELVRGWLGDWLVNAEKAQESNSIAQPFMRNGKFVITTTGFARWLFERNGQKYAPAKLAVELRKLRCKPVHAEFTLDGRIKQRRVWELHPSIIVD